eukprot:COSAG01_NODE_1999_length_8688_cov_6.237280_11_plen_115_part_00
MRLSWIARWILYNLLLSVHLAIPRLTQRSTTTLIFCCDEWTSVSRRSASEAMLPLQPAPPPASFASLCCCCGGGGSGEPRTPLLFDAFFDSFFPLLLLVLELLDPLRLQTSSTP